MATQIDIAVFKFHEIWPTGNRRNRALPLKLSLLRASHSKSVRASPKQYNLSAPDFIQIGPVSAEL